MSGHKPLLTGLSAVILAGGKSSRFGSDKASALLLGRPLLQWVVSALEPVCAAFVVVRANGQVLPDITSVRPILEAEDRYDGKGPLAGLVTGFAAVQTDLAFAVSCDAPLVRPALVELLLERATDADIVCPLVEARLQPLVSLYRVQTCLPVFRAAVEAEQLKITAAFGRLRLTIVDESSVRSVDPDLRSFRNANRPETLAEIEALLRTRD